MDYLASISRREMLFTLAATVGMLLMAAHMAFGPSAGPRAGLYGLGMAFLAVSVMLRTAARVRQSPRLLWYSGMGVGFTGGMILATFLL